MPLIGKSRCQVAIAVYCVRCLIRLGKIRFFSLLNKATVAWIGT